MCAVDEPEIGVYGAAADRNVRAALQAFGLGAEALTGRDARHQGDKLHEIAAVERQLSDLVAFNEAS